MRSIAFARVEERVLLERDVLVVRRVLLWRLGVVARFAEALRLLVLVACVFASGI